MKLHRTTPSVPSMTCAPPPIKGAPGHVLRLLARHHARNGHCTLSYEAIAAQTGYSPAAVKLAIRQLLAGGYIHVTKRFGDRRNTYILSPACSVEDIL